MQKHRGLTLVDLAPNKPSTAEFRLAVAVSFFKTVVEHKWPLVTNLRGSTYREGLPHHRRPMKDTLSTAIKPSGPLNSQQQEFEKQLRSRLSQTNINQMDWCGIWEGRGGGSEREKGVSPYTITITNNWRHIQMFKHFQTAADNSWEAEDSRTLSRWVNLSRAERFDSLQSVALNEKDLRGIMNTRGDSMAVVFVPQIPVT